MKKLLLLALLAFHCIGAFAQEKPKTIFISISVKDNSLQAKDFNVLSSALIDNFNQKYTVLNRSKEFDEILQSEFEYEAQGFVRDDQLHQLGERLKADEICIVTITCFNDVECQYYFDAQILDLSSSYIVDNAHILVDSIDYNIQNEVAFKLAYDMGIINGTDNEYIDAETIDDNMLRVDDVNGPLGMNIYKGNTRLYYYDFGKNENKYGRLKEIMSVLEPVGLYDDFIKAKRLAKTGDFCVMVGAPLLGVSIGSLAFSIKHKDKINLHKLTVGYFCIGSAVLIGGITSKLFAVKKVRQIVTQYNSTVNNKYSQITYGITNNGFGIMYEF